MFLLVSFSLLVVIYFYLWFYIKRTSWCRSQKCLLGKTCIITGANTGIGFETALDFAKRGARVILACRNEQLAEKACRDIIKKSENPNIVYKIVDLASFSSVSAFAKDVKKSEKRLDILVNNAGIGLTGDVQSADGNVLIMQVNHFSSFLLTHLLLDLLTQTDNSRIVNVASIMGKYATFDLKNLNAYTGIQNTYSCSKLCNIFFTMVLAEKLANTKCTTFSVHPGIVSTDLFRQVSGTIKIILDFFKSAVFRDCSEGAQTTIYAALTHDIEHLSGQHFDNCQVVQRYPTADVPELAHKVWEKTAEIVGLEKEN